MTIEWNEHPDRTSENERLDFTKTYIDVVIKTSETNKDQFKKNIQEAFGGTDWLDSGAAYNEILTNASFFEMSKEELEALKKARNKPYFARIDFIPEESMNREKHYLGKTSLYQRENQEQMIVDWRSPIANLYYEGRLGGTSYEANGDLYKGELALKRQLMIEEGDLTEIRDIDLTTTDELLQDSLAKSSSNRLTEIISTIQEEQNRIIRADLNKPIIVQGAAGSGKTTIALHRISYFIYQYKNHFDASQLMILAPSKLFIDYISEALPELGVEKIRQTTFADYAQSCIGRSLHLIEDDKLIRFLEEESEQNKKALMISNIKGSKSFYRVLVHYVQDIENSIVPIDDFYVDKYRLYSKKQFLSLFQNDFSYMPIYKRLDRLKMILQNQVRLQKKNMIDRVEHFYDQRLEKALFHRSPSDERKEYVTKALEKKNERIVEVKKNIRTAVSSYMRFAKKKSVLVWYKELFEDPKKIVVLSGGLISQEQAEDVAAYTLNMIKKKKYELEDLAPLLYLEHRLNGIDKDLRSKNVVIDEAQDYSYMQIQTLKKSLETDMFTLVGDLAQGIHSYRGTNDWESIHKEIFPRGIYTELQKSYRTTVEIMKQANLLLKKLPNKFPEVEPVVRHGNEPEFHACLSKTKLGSKLLEDVEVWKKQEFKTFAIITKTMKDALLLWKEVEKIAPGEVFLLEESSQIPKNKIVLLPSYLSKGLEFDCVMIASYSESYRSDRELDVKLLYVSMTRPLHRLNFYGKKKEDFLIDKQ